VQQSIVTHLLPKAFIVISPVALTTLAASINLKTARQKIRDKFLCHILEFCKKALVLTGNAGKLKLNLKEFIGLT
jgi:hypothetical protein